MNIKLFSAIPDPGQVLSQYQLLLRFAVYPPCLACDLSAWTVFSPFSPWHAVSFVCRPFMPLSIHPPNARHSAGCPGQSPAVL